MAKLLKLEFIIQIYCLELWCKTHRRNFYLIAASNTLLIISLDAAPS